MLRVSFPKIQMTTSLADYRQAALSRAKNKTPERILNDSLSHAQVLIESMIGLAALDDEVCIYSGDLPRASYGIHLNTCQSQLIRIVVDDVSHLEWLKELSSYGKGQLRVRKISAPRPNHFFCISSGAFRFETDAQSFRAEANYFEPPTVAKLKEAFDIYWSSGSEVSVLPDVTVSNHVEISQLVHQGL